MEDFFPDDWSTVEPNLEPCEISEWSLEMSSWI